jgi:ABC-type polysaccharide/polyol phosphate export permease/outer membrane murein-binding lipoprotein Lpp
MRSLWLLTKKNIKLLIRAKSSALIVVLAPLLIILLLGLSFNTSEKVGLNVGVHATSFSDDTGTFIASLEEEGYKVVKYQGAIDDCLEDVQQNFVHTCVSLPESFSIEGNNAKEITFHVDPSRVNLVWLIQETMREKLNLKSQEISEQLSANVLGTLVDTQSKVVSEQSKLRAAQESTVSAYSTSNTLKTNLLGIDLGVPTTNYDPEVLNSFESTLSDSVDKGKEAVDDAQDALDNLNLTDTNKNIVSSLLNDAEDSFATIDSLLGSSVETNGTNETTNSGASELASSINQLRTDLDATKAKLAAASDAIQRSSGEFDAIANSLNNGVSSIEEVQATLNTINENLGGQKVTEAGVLANPLIIKIEKINAGKTYLNYLFPALMVLVIMFSSLLLGTTLVMMEKNSPAFMRNYFLPLRKVTFVLSTYLTNLVLILIQLVVILGVSLIFLPELLVALPGVALVLFLAGTIFTFLGMIVGYIFASEETAVLGSISLGSLFLFVSGVILPLETMPASFREVTTFSPFVLAEKLVRDLFIFGTKISAVWIDIVMLLGYVVVLFLIILILESVLHKHLTHRFLKHHHKRHRHAQKVKGKEV